MYFGLDGKTVSRYPDFFGRERISEKNRETLTHSNYIL